MKRNAVFEDVLKTVSRYFIVAVILILLFICFSGVRFIKSGNVALILRFGKLVGNTYEEQVHEPGLLFAFPYVIDEVITVPTGSVIEQKVTTHYTESKMTDLRSNGYVITGDKNIAIISASVKYTISDPVAYALKVKDIESIVNASVSCAMVESAARMSVDDILTSGKEAFSNDAIERAQNKLAKAQTGITISSLELTEVSMPQEVRDIYERVNATTVESNTSIINANRYRERVIPDAQGKAQKAINDANSEYSKSVSAANTALAEFWGVLEEYKANPELVRARIYNDKMAEAIEKIGTVKVVSDGGNNIFIEQD